MRIGLLSDTHIPIDAEELPSQLKQAFTGVDLILHAGDIYRAYVLDELQTIAPVIAALGDDDPTTLAIAQRAKSRHTLKLAGLTLLLMHYRPDIDFFTTDEMEPSMLEIYQNRPDIIVFGHEHRTFLEQQNGILVINPGSPTFLHYHNGPGTVGILDINAGKVDAHIVQLSELSRQQ